jgi:hypothetical protein
MVIPIFEEYIDENFMSAAIRLDGAAQMILTENKGEFLCRRNWKIG